MSHFWTGFFSAALSGAMAASVVVVRTKQLQRRFKIAGATSSKHAVTLQSLGMVYTWLFDRMVGRGVFVSTPDGRYYLDEKAADRRSRRIRIFVLATMPVCLAAVLLLWLAGMIGR